MTALDTLTTAIALLSAAAGPEASEAAMRRDDWWHLCREADRKPLSVTRGRLSAVIASKKKWPGAELRSRPGP